MKRLYWLFFIPSFAYALCDDIDDVEQKQACAVSAYQEADTELNTIYQSIRKALSNEQKQKLKQAQLAWLTFRDANCAHQVSESDEDNKTIKYLCLTQVTQFRTRELQNIYSYLFIGYTPVEYDSLHQALSMQKLVGRWKSQSEEYGIFLHFQIIDGKALFFSTLNEQPFESGSWQFTDGQLIIMNELGDILYLYNQVTLENNTLTLYEKEGGTEQYQRVDDN